jgi:hypothetical protein
MGKQKAGDSSEHALCAGLPSSAPAVAGLLLASVPV